MTLPPWKASGPEDRAALTRFIIDELDRQDEALAEASTGDPRAIGQIAAVVDATALAAKIGARVILPARPVKPGPKPADPADDKFPAFDRAALDVPRIRALFRLHWGKRNRTELPMAEHIAAERWGLSAEEANQLADKFRKTPLSR